MGTTIESRISSTQAKDAIFKMHNVQSGASEIDNAVTNHITQAELDAAVLGSGNITPEQAVTIDGLSGLTKSGIEINETIDSIYIDIYDDNLEEVVDKFGNIIRTTDINGNMLIPSMDNKTIQDFYKESQDSIHEGGAYRPRDILQVEDEEGNITARQDNTGGFYITGLNGSIQAVTSQSVDKIIYYPTDEREKLHSSVKPLIQDLVIEGRPFIKPPTSLVPNNFFVPDSFINAFTTAPDDNGLWLETPYHDGGLVHPYLLTMREPLQGYKYWFSDTPHLSGASEENPCLWGTNSLEYNKRRFDLIPNLSQPLGRPDMSGNYWNSDEELVYNPIEGKLTLHWRGGINSTQSKHRDTWNGIDFTPEVEIPEINAIGALLSPATLYDPRTQIWHRWGVYSEGILRHYTSNAFDGVWTLSSTINFNELYNINIWHIEVKYIGEKFVMLIDTRNTGSNLYFAVSNDGDSWKVGSKLLPEGTICYKGTFEPEWDGDNLRFWIGWNTYSFPRVKGVIQYLYINPTNWVNINTLTEDI